MWSKHRQLPFELLPFTQHEKFKSLSPSQVQSGSIFNLFWAQPAHWGHELSGLIWRWHCDGSSDMHGRCLQGRELLAHVLNSNSLSLVTYEGKHTSSSRVQVQPATRQSCPCWRMVSGSSDSAFNKTQARGLFVTVINMQQVGFRVQGLHIQAGDRYVNKGHQDRCQAGTASRGRRVQQQGLHSRIGANITHCLGA